MNWQFRKLSVFNIFKLIDVDKYTGGDENDKADLVNERRL